MLGPFQLLIIVLVVIIVILLSISSRLEKVADTPGTGTGNYDEKISNLEAQYNTLESQVNNLGSSGRPTIQGDISGRVTESYILNSNLVTLGFLYVNGDDAATFDTTVVPTREVVGSLTISPEGRWDYTVANSLARRLGNNKAHVDNFTVQTTTGLSQKIQIAIIGIDSGGMITGVYSKDITRNQSSGDGYYYASGKLTVVDDADDGENGFRVGSTGEGSGQVPAKGIFEIQSDGDWTYKILKTDADAITADPYTYTEAFAIYTIGGQQTYVNIRFA